MEIKINKEIREYKENIYFGLSMRQFFFSIIACVVAVGLYFILRPYFGLETLSWVCILGAFPFAILGFVTYNGMTAEKFLVAWIKSEILTPKVLYRKKFEKNSSNSNKKFVDKEKSIYEDAFEDIFLDDEIYKRRRYSTRGKL